MDKPFPENSKGPAEPAPQKTAKQLMLGTQVRTDADDRN